MATRTEHKNHVVAAVKKLMADKKAAIAYSKGEISKQELDDRGVKLGMPLQGNI